MTDGGVGSGAWLNEAAARRRGLDILRRTCDSPETMIKSDAKIKFGSFVSRDFEKNRQSRYPLAA